ncbi:MAG: nucleotidyltransferase domain-containing protein [Patescibacteria group bacterium]
MDFDITTNTIFLTLTGSRVYGTSTPESDYDYRGVAIPPEIYFLGYGHKFDQHESSSPHDSVVYGFNKFLKLAVDNNPNILELLYIEPRFWVTTSLAWERLVQHRDWFLSTKCYHTFRGYAAAQLKRVRSHRAWLLQGELQEPKREDFGLPANLSIPRENMEAADELARRFLGQHDIEEDLAALAQHDKPMATAFRQRLHEFIEIATGLPQNENEARCWTAAAQQLGYDANFLDLLQREKQYRQAKRHYESWLHWKAERNEKRKIIEAKCGFDAKFVSHVYRLMYSCREILQNGTLTVTRPEAPFLREILDGHFTFEELEQQYKTLEQEIDSLYAVTTLQHQPRRREIEDLGVEIARSYLADRK